MSTPRIFPLGVSYAPFWRGRYVDAGEWESDLRNMKALGFTYLSVFTPWQRFEREKGRFDFTELERVISLADQVGLRVSVGIGVHRSFSLYPPRWLMEEYRGVGMLDKDDKPTVSGSYKLPCFEDSWYRDYAERYLVALTRRFAGSPALAQWRVWGEASLFDLCYCPFHAAKFRDWLNEKYGGLPALNDAWGSEGPSDFSRWEQVFPPKDAYHFYGFTAWLDWQEFLDGSLTANVKWVHDIVKREDPDHETLIELVVKTRNSSGQGNEVWRMAGAADLLGLSIYNVPIADYAKQMDMMRCAAEFNGKQAWAIEVQGGPRLFAWQNPCTPSADQMTLWMWELVAHGVKGVFYWTYRARTSDLEGGEFSMVRRDGSIPERTRHMGEEFEALQQHAGLLLDSRRTAEAAIFWSRDAEHLARIDREDTEQRSCYTHSVYDCHELLWRAGVPADFIERSSLTVENLSKYKVILLPFMFSLDRATADVLKEYVRRGGRVIADFLCGSKDPRGHTDRVLPGFGLDEMFGLLEDEISAANDAEIRTERGPVIAHRFLKTLRLRGAEATGALASGEPVFARHRYGDGEAVLLGTMMFHRDAWRTHPANQAYLLNLLRDYGVTAPASFIGDAPVEGDPLEIALLDTADGRQMLMLLNHTDCALTGTVRVRSACGTVTDLRTGQRVAATRDGDLLAFPVAGLASLRVNLYVLDA